MGINTKLLPIKVFFFIALAGCSPIVPFIPIIGKDLGFSSIAIGWIFTAAPICTIFLKPLIGSFADKYSCQKFIFISIIVVQAIMIFSIKFIPPLPTVNLVDVNCTKDPPISACTEKLKDESYSSVVLARLNSSLNCELSLPPVHGASTNTTNQTAIPQSGTFRNIIINLNNVSLQGKCVSIGSNISHENLNCDGTLKAAFDCHDDAIRDLTKNPKLEGSAMFLTYNYWLFFLIVVFLKVILSTGMSFGDTICFYLLGEKRENFGAQRMWGSVGWGLMSIVAGYVVDRVSRGKLEKDFSVSYYICFVLLMFNAVMMLTIKANFKKKSKNIFKDVKKLFTSAKINIFIVWCIVSGIYAALERTYLFWFIEDLAERYGTGNSGAYIKTLEGLVLTIHCYAGEIPFLFMSGHILKKIGHEWAMRLVIFTFALRYLVYAILTNPWWILPVESLNGITFGILYATMTTYASSFSPPGTEATVQNLVTAIYEGFGTTFGALLGGYLFKLIGTSKTFLMVGISAVIFGVILVVLQMMFKSDSTVYYSGVNVEMKEVDKEKQAMNPKENNT